MNFISLFSGIGELDLGLERAGMTCVIQVEIDDFCQKVLNKHWPNIPKFKDIRDVGKDNLPTAELVCGGFPCQDVSLAGKRKGLEGKRSTLWSEFYRVVCEIQPRWVVIENVTGLYTSNNGRFFTKILRELSQSGYDAEWDTIPASSVGAPHYRERIFIVAHARSITLNDRQILTQDSIDFDEWWKDSEKWGIYRVKPEMGTTLIPRLPCRWQELNTESKLPRMVDGVPNGLDRIKALGNSVVPQVAEFIGHLIMNAESKITQ